MVKIIVYKLCDICPLSLVLCSPSLHPPSPEAGGGVVTQQRCPEAFVGVSLTVTVGFPPSPTWVI